MKFMIITLLWVTSFLVSQSSAYTAASFYSTRIIGGTAAALRELPYQVSIRLNNVPVCGGAIVTAYNILTTVSCLTSTNATAYTVKAGMLQQSVVEPTNQLRTVKTIIRHASYSASTKLNDIAVLTVDRPFKLDVAVQAIPLAPAGQEVLAGTNLIVSGWGGLYMNGPLSDSLLKVDVPVVSNTSCQSTFGTTVITNTVLCAGGQAGKGTCTGDYGGPLATTTAASRLLIGLAVRTINCGLTGYPTIYTKISAHRPWILTNAGV